jgi:DNA-binding NarL/FixJ family response regulator
VEGGGGDSVGGFGAVIRVLLVDDQLLVRAGLRRLLRPKAGFDVVGECADGGEVEQAVLETWPDIVIMDLRMKVVDGAEATRRLRQRSGSPPVLVLTTFDDDEALSASLRAGASGFQLKDAAGEELIQAVRAVAAGEAWLDPAVTGRVLAAYRDGAAQPSIATKQLEMLTPREAEVLALIGRGATNEEIAEKLVIGEGTVKTHVGHIFTKLDLRDRPAAIVFAFDHGLVTPQA